MFRFRAWNFSNISKAIVNANRLKKFDGEAENVNPQTLQDAIGEGRVEWVLMKLTEANNEGNNLLLDNEIIIDNICLRKKGEKVHDTLRLTPLHYAILCSEISMVKMMLEFASETQTLLHSISMITIIEFIGTIKDYYKDDVSLDGVNAIHLATRFHAKSLLLIIQYLLKNNLMGKMCCLCLPNPKSKM